MPAMEIRLVFLQICPRCDDGARAAESNDVTTADGTDGGTRGVIEAPGEEYGTLGEGARCGEEAGTVSSWSEKFGTTYTARYFKEFDLTVTSILYPTIASAQPPTMNMPRRLKTSLIRAMKIAQKHATTYGGTE